MHLTRELKFPSLESFKVFQTLLKAAADEAELNSVPLTEERVFEIYRAAILGSNSKDTGKHTVLRDCADDINT